MAVVNNFNQDDQNQQQQNQNGNNVSQPISVSGTSAPSASAGLAGGGTGNASVAPTVQNAPTSSGRFQNLQNYLQANSGYNAAGGGLAGQITGDLGKQEKQQEQTIQQQQQDWVNANQSKNIDPNAASQYVQSGIQNATQFVQDPNAVSQFQNYLNAGTNYVAPTAFDASQGLANQVQNYQTTAGLTQTEPGRYTLLNNLYNNPNYSQGQQKLDNLLLQGDSNQLNTLNQAQDYAQNLSNAYNAANTGINGTFDPTANASTGGLIQQYANNAQATQLAAQNALGGAINTFGTNAAQAAQDAAAARDQAYQQALTNLGRNQISQADLDKFGLTPNMTLLNVNPTSYLTENQDTPTIQNSITADQQSYINALSKLAGNSLSGDPTQVLSSFNNNQAAGTFGSNPYSLNTNALNNEVQKAQQSYNNELTSLYRPTELGGVLTQATYNPVQDITNLQADNAARQSIGSYPDTGGNVLLDRNNATIAQNNQQIAQLMDIINKYNINPQTGLANSVLKTIAQQGTIGSTEAPTVRNVIS